MTTLHQCLASRTIACAALLVLLGGCPAGQVREQGENGGRCFDNNKCKPGLACVSGWCLVPPEAGLCPRGDGGSCTGCPDLGPRDGGGCPDSKPCPSCPDAGCPDASPCPLSDGGACPDAGPCPTCPDSGPCTDAGACKTCPKVLLKTPAKGATSASRKQQFVFQVTAANPLTQCQLLVNGKVLQTLTTPGSGGSFTHDNIADGVYTWDVSCKDNQGNVGFSGEGRLFTSAPKLISACKKTGWAANTKYKLSADIAGASGNCMVINAADVLLDGNGKSIYSAKTKDIVYHRAKDERVTVLANQLTPTGGGFVNGWKSPYSGKQNWSGGNAADFDGDGDLDLVTNEFGGKWRVFSNNGSGSFGGASAFSAGSGMGFDVSRVLDFDHDGKLDVFLSHDGGNEMFYRGSSSTSSFSAGFSANLGTYTHDLAIGEFNGDGKIDVITGSNYGGADDLRHLRVNALGVGSGGGFNAAWNSAANEERGSGASLVADLDGDNDYDLVLPRNRNVSDVRTYVRLNNGKGTGFAKVLEVSSTLPVAAVDVDGDDDTDLLLHRYSSGSISEIRVYRNNGAASFSLASSTGLPGNRRVAAVVDLDLDGDPDLILAESGYFKSFEIYTNSGKGKFTKSWTSLETGQFESFHVRDFDNDGDLDIFAVASQGSGVATRQMMLYRNNGAGGFTSVWARGTSGNKSYTAFSLGDLDGAPAAGVRILGADVVLKNFAGIQGFSYGVDVQANGSSINDVVVTDPDIYAVRFQQVSSGTLKKVRVKYLYQGTGLAVIDSSKIQIQDSNFCGTGPKPMLVSLSAYCAKSSGLTGANNRLRFNNGCAGFGWKSCK